MIDSRPDSSSYALIKDSGVESLGRIPQHWKISRFRNLFSFDKGLSITKENLQDEGVPCINYGDVHSRFGFEVNPEYHALKCVSQDFLKENARSLLRIGDIIFADTSEDIDGSGNFSQLTDGNLVFAGYHTIIARPIGVAVNRYLAYLLDSVAFRVQIRRAVKGVKVYSITKSILKETSVWLPSALEQEFIASYLDRNLIGVDRAIQIKEGQIELLKERKQILIQQAVTRGLNPEAPMRDSGIEWIGEIPAHWSIKRAKYIFREVDERSQDGQQELLSVSHLTGVTPRSEKNVSMFMAEDYTGSKMCRKDDLVFNIMWAWMGALGVADRTGIVSSSYGIFRQLKPGTLNPQYLEMLLKTTTYIEHYNKVSTGLHSSRLRFYGHMFMAMEIGFPSREEQDSIVAHLDIESEKINKATDLLEQQIGKLKEYKATLINSAVTGKIKVPGVVEPEAQDMEVV